jgi:TetR/AcrR family transcriptional regulator
VRQRLLDAALEEFSAVGFEAASTRRIAEAAVTHQPQINYHFASKLGLWQSVMTKLFAELDEAMRGIETDRDAHEVLADMCRRFVYFAARRPEMNRIMVHESTAPSDRLDWLVRTHIQARFDGVARFCALLDPESVPTTDPVLFYYCMVGASSLLSVNANEALLLTGDDPLRSRVDAHADAVTRMALGPSPRSLPRPGRATVGHGSVVTDQRRAHRAGR